MTQSRQKNCQRRYIHTHSVHPKMSLFHVILFLVCIFSSHMCTLITRCSWGSPHAGNFALQHCAAALTFKTNSCTRLQVCGVSLQHEIVTNNQPATYAGTCYQIITLKDEYTKRHIILDQDTKSESPAIHILKKASVKSKFVVRMGLPLKGFYLGFRVRVREQNWTGCHQKGTQKVEFPLWYDTLAASDHCIS